MRSTDRDIAILAIEVLFNICIPSSSISNSLNDDWIDSFEVLIVIYNSLLNIILIIWYFLYISIRSQMILLEMR